MHYDSFGTSEVLVSHMHLCHRVHPFHALFQKISKCVEFQSLCEGDSTNKMSMLMEETYLIIDVYNIPLDVSMVSLGTKA